MGFWTFTMLTCWKIMFLANPLLGLGQDLILTPFWVPVKFAVVIVTFWTPISCWFLPKLPMLHQQIVPMTNLASHYNIVVIVTKYSINQKIDKISLPYSMPGSTCYILNPHINGTRSNWDAIITRLHIRVENCDIGR